MEEGKDEIEMSYNKEHKFSKLYAEFVHSISHSGLLTSVSKVRLQFWVINLMKMMKAIVYHCISRRK